MKKYIVASVFLLAKNEILSLIILCVIGLMFIYDMFGWMQEGKW